MDTANNNIEKNKIMENLRQSILKDLELQEKLRKDYQRIIKRTSVLSIGQAIIIILFLSTITYVNIRPVPKSALDQLEKLLNTTQTQMNTVAKAREDWVKIQENQIDIQRNQIRQDSIYLEFKKALNGK